MSGRARSPAAPTVPTAATAPVPPTWTTGSTEVFKTGTWRAALARHVQAPSPCHHACPVGGEIASWIGHARGGDLRAAWEVLVRHNPFPAIAGRICHHPCEGACNRVALGDEAVSIGRLERFVGDHALAQGWRFEAPAAATEGHVGVLGGGPAGLSAAYQLRRRGWRVTIYEATDALGGVMRHGIPAYRLPRDVLDGEIERLLALGIEVRLRTTVDAPAAFEALRSRHDAVFVGIGAGLAKRLPTLEYSAPWAMDGAAYLAAANAGRPPAPPSSTRPSSVVVIGGGSAALDAARTARRAGHDVTILALESRAQMPAMPEEIEEALEEGVSLIDSAMLRAALPGRHADEPPAALRLQCQRVRFVAGPASGQFSIEPVADGGFEIRADLVLSSIGQDPDLTPLGVPHRAGALLTVDEAGRTGLAGDTGVWAGGDVATQARHVTAAVGMGERAALGIHRQLLGLAEVPAAAPAVVRPESIATWYHPRRPRALALRRCADDRRASVEVELGLEPAQALAESERCFSCGTCIACDNCVVVCPDLAVRRIDGTGAVAAELGAYEVLADYCKGCGLCVRECPTGSMTMVEERR